MAVGRRGAIYGVIALMLCVAVYLNWSYVNLPDEMVVADQAAQENGQSKDSKDDTKKSEETSKNYGDTTLVDGEVSDETVTTGVSDYFAQSRLSRQKARDEAISILKQTTDNAASTESDKTTANKQISDLADNAVKESRTESLIKAKGYKDCVVFISDDGINVIVATPEEGFTAADASKIKDIVIDETKVKADKIKIVET